MSALAAAALALAGCHAAPLRRRRRRGAGRYTIRHERSVRRRGRPGASPARAPRRGGARGRRRPCRERLRGAGEEAFLDALPSREDALSAAAPPSGGLR